MSTSASATDGRFSQRDFRTAMGQFCTGVVIVTGLGGDSAPCGFSAQSFVSVSLDPPLVAVCPANSSQSWPRIRAGGHFGINILAADQQALCARFARSGGNKFADLGWSPSARGMPMLDRVLGFIECRLEHEFPAGDHCLALGRVLELQVRATDRPPLLFFRGAYGAFGDCSSAA